MAPVDEWLDCVAAELADWFTDGGWPTPVKLETVFVGGGTPSLLSGDGMPRLRDVLRQRCRWDASRLEWTAEANPASLTARLLASWREAGVTRLSLGVQSFDDGALAWLGRLHDESEARSALARARAAGFHDVNLDLIFGLPASVPRDWRSEVAAAVDAGVTHVSVYGLTAEPDTPLGRRVGQGRVRMPDEDRYESEYVAAAEELEQAGFVHYEVSNFARPGRECRHNWQYWDGSSYLGVGPSAHSHLGGTRLWNVYSWEAYRRALGEGRSPREGFETIGAGESRLERLWLAFRTNRGLPAEDPLNRFVRREAGGMLTAWRDAGWLTETGGGLRLTRSGWLRMDAMVASLEARMESILTPGSSRE
jgi:oxygen-independent coproporphyrinogen-3 oxidase